jgi:hypothetical protein
MVLIKDSGGSRHDLVCPRKGRSLEGLIKARGEELGLKCSVEGWEEAWQLERIFDRF